MRRQSQAANPTHPKVKSNQHLTIFKFGKISQRKPDALPPEKILTKNFSAIRGHEGNQYFDQEPAPIGEFGPSCCRL